MDGSTLYLSPRPNTTYNLIDSWRSRPSLSTDLPSRPLTEFLNLATEPGSLKPTVVELPVPWRTGVVAAYSSLESRPACATIPGYAEIDSSGTAGTGS
jgi:hypothetical protein